MKLQFFLLTAVAFAFACNSNSGNKTSTDSTVVSTEDSAGTVTGTEFPEHVYWGDEHLHTSWSADAGASGTRVGPEEALRFARGEEVKSSTGQMAKLGRPLDWLAVADHSDGAGVISAVIDGDPSVMGDPIVAQYHKDMKEGGAKAQKVMEDLINRQSNNTLPKVFTDPGFAKTVWEKNCDIVDKYNNPGKFTAFVAFEWTSNYNGGNNLHRNVLYREGGDKGKQMAPMTTFDSENPEDLWKWMANLEEKTGMHVLAIPHNGNLSNGLMFKTSAFDGTPLTPELAKLRNKYEVLYEVTQNKGTSETHPSLSPYDEFADYEIWDKGNLVVVPKKPGMIQYEYVRNALKNGMAMEDKLGVNPFKFGLVGGTDSHTGLTTSDDDNWWGKYATEEPGPKRMEEYAMNYPSGKIEGWKLGAAGYTGVWATANTREALWDAMKRRETYGSTGPRMTIRFFGGFDFAAGDMGDQLATVGYKKGVPMGGDLQAAPAGKKPVFLIAAWKDPQHGNLDRVQVIKGWVDAKGVTHEKVYDVSWSDMDKRKPDAKGKLPAVGNTVDAATATYKNTIGATELKTVWTDPEFDPSLKAFYYLRVLQIPTPRWSTYDASRYKVPLPKGAPASIQERAYTSPIWYHPAK